MFDGLTDRETYGLLGAALILIAIGFGAGAVFSGDLPGAASSGQASQEEIKGTVDDFMEGQLDRQRQQLQTMAQRSENLTQEDVSLESSVESVGESEFGSLKKVTLTIEGQVPSQTGGTRSVSQQQELYVTPDGRYLFQSPADLNAQSGPQMPGGGHP